MRFSMLYSGEQILSFKSCFVFYTGDSLKLCASSTDIVKRFAVIKSVVIKRIHCIK